MSATPLFAASLFCLSIALPLSAQEASAPVRWHFVDQATVPDLRAGAPEYARLLYTDTVDLRELERAFEAHYAERGEKAKVEDLERDPYAKFFHQWYRGAQNFVDDDGVVRALDTKQLKRFRAAHARPATIATDVAGPVSAWSFVGPERTVWRKDHDPVQKTAPWQVNIYCIAAAPSDPAVLYCGSETGAVYKSENRGVNWVPLDNFNWGSPALSIAVHPTDPDIAYVATSSDIIKTIDGGSSWTILLTQSGLSCNSLAISPQDPSIVVAGAASGLWRSTDAGATWSPALSAHIDDLEFRPGDGSTIYALARTGGPDTYTLYKSTDAGVSFAPSMSGWGTHYESSGGRLTVTPADPDYVYAVLLTHDGSNGDPKPVILKTTDSAGSWSVVASCNSGACPLTNGQGYYDLDIVASHSDPEHLIVATTTAYRSTNGGSSWSAVGGYAGPFAIHPDIQAMISIMDGATENTWIATDGGTNFSTDFYATTANWEARVDGLDGTDFWGFAQGWNEDYAVGGRYHNGNTALHENYPAGRALRLGGAESVTGWALHGRERHAAFDDIEELILPAAIDAAPEGTFLFTKHPQNFFYGDAFSRVMVDPADFMTVYVGDTNQFWRSRDGGASWEATHNFNGQVYHFDISRADPDRIYLTTDRGFRRSNDRGETFGPMPLPSSLSNWHARNLRVAASSTDPDVVWVLNQRSSAGSNAPRVFMSDDGGATWTNWTTAALDGRKWTAIAHQAGTNGGVYIASQRGEAGTNPARVMYRDASMSDWADHSTGLPPSANPIKLVPFYRDGKLRWAGNRGLWEIDFYESDWAPQARPFVSGATQICVRDTVEFDSYSVAKGTATYAWSVPGASSTSDLNSRQVEALFPGPGTYTATLTVTQDGMSDSESVNVTVTDECGAESAPGRALRLSGESGDWAATTRSLDVTTNTMTISAWIKRDGPQEPFAGVVFMRGSSSAGLNFRTPTTLGFHWDNQDWQWSSGLPIPNGEWTHVALVVTPDDTTIYVNGVRAVNSNDRQPFTFDSVMNFGADPNWAARRFRGEMDEVLIYDRALTQAEVRERMHLVCDPPSETGLLGYWQFNRESGRITDRAGTNHASLIGNAARVRSTAPVGAGHSARRDVSGPGVVAFGDTGLTLEFDPDAILYPNGEIAVTRLDRRPDEVPTQGVTDAYWIVHNFGSNTHFSVLERLTFSNIPVGAPDESRPARTRFYKRAIRAEGHTWGSAVDRADSATAGPDGSVTFEQANGQTSFGQYIVSFESLIELDPSGTGSQDEGPLVKRP